jgi:hypothetical protein
MSCTHFNNLIVEVLSGVAAEGDRDRLMGHLDACPACTRAYLDLQNLVSAKRVHEDPGETYWESYYARLNDRIASEQAPVSAPTVRLLPRWSVNVAAVILVLFSGIWLERNVLRESSNEVHEHTAIQAALEERAFSYLDRSKTLLLGVANFNPEEDNLADLNMDRRKVLASGLVQEAGLLQKDLSRAEEMRLARLISDLQVILLQIANMESEYDLPEIELVQNGVNRQAIFFKIEVESMREMIAPSKSAFAQRPSPDPSI